MITNKILPAHILRLFAWELWRLNAGITEISTAKGDLIPVVPVEDEPIISDSGSPYGVYGYAEQEATPIPQERRGVFSLRVIAPTFGQTGRLLNIIANAFEDPSIAAEKVNYYSSQYGNGELIGIRFTHCKVTYIEGGDAPESEGGPVDGAINITYRYVTQQDTVYPVDGGLWS